MEVPVLDAKATHQASSCNQAAGQRWSLGVSKNTHTKSMLANNINSLALGSETRLRVPLRCNLDCVQCAVGPNECDRSVQTRIHKY